MKARRALLSMVMCLALFALILSPVAPALAQGDRVIELNGVSNFRDLGGYEGDLGPIEWGKIFRSGHFASFDNNWQGLGIKTVIDLRNDGDKMRDSLYNPESLGAWWVHWEIVPSSGMRGTLDPDDPDTWHGHDVFHEDGDLYVSVPFNQGDPTSVGWSPPYTDTWQYHNIILWSLVDNWPGPDSSALDYWYVGILEANKPAIKEVFEILADPGNYPLVFHCTQGKDRVGTVSALLLDLLGVPAETIIQDYALTKDLTADATAMTLAQLEAAIHYSNHYDEDWAFIHGLMPVGAEASHWEPAICIHMPAIQNLLGYVQFMYGGAEGFLTSIGVHPNDLIKVRANLLGLPPGIVRILGMNI